MNVKVKWKVLAQVGFEWASNIGMLAFIISAVVLITKLDFPWIWICGISFVVMIAAWLAEDKLGGGG